MTINKRFLRLRRLLKFIPRLLAHLEILETYLPRLEALDGLLVRLDGFDERLKALDRALLKMENIDKMKPAEVLVPAVSNGNGHSDDHDLNRLKILGKFVQLAGKAQQIEKEWQKIQQDEHDAFFAFQVFRGKNEVEHAYKKGVTDGIKWCVDRFS